MFDSVDARPDVAALAGLCAALGALSQDVDAETRIDRIQVLERLRGAVAAAQARETAAFAAGQRADQAAAGIPAARVG